MNQNVAMARPTPSERVRRLVTPSGIEIWHVEDYTVPVISIEFAFLGGAAEDPIDRTGLGNLMAGLLDEGAGDLRAEAFQEALEEKAIELSFDCGRDRLDGSLRTLSQHADRAFALLALAVGAPRFDADAIDRVRAQVISGLKRDEMDPQARARDAIYRLGFAGHSYGRPVDGRIEELGGITRQDLVEQHRSLLARDTLRVVAVGAISSVDLEAGIDRAFAALPAHATLKPLAPAALQGAGQLEVIDIEIPQSTLYLALPGLPRRHPDFIAANVVNHILGGGSFTSRLWTEIREKRGLVYTIHAFHAAYADTGLFGVYAGTGPQSLPDLGPVACAEIARLADTITEEEAARARAQMRARLLMGREDMMHRADTGARHLLLKGRALDVAALVAKIDAVDAPAIAAAARRVFAGPPTLAALGPITLLEPYERIAARLPLASAAAGSV